MGYSETLLDLKPLLFGGKMLLPLPQYDTVFEKTLSQL